MDRFRAASFYRQFWLPDYNYHYEIPDADLEAQLCGVLFASVKPRKLQERSLRLTQMVPWMPTASS